jgi:hypothetical protein
MPIGISHQSGRAGGKISPIHRRTPSQKERRHLANEPPVFSEATMNIHLPIAVITAFLLTSGLAQAGPDNIFMVRTTSKTPDALVAAVKSYTEDQKWRFISEDKAKQGEVILVKICIPEVGKLVWQAGLRASALLPCGNMGIYSNGTTTEISVLHPRYMHILYPDPALERAGAVAAPLLLEMLDAVTE